MVTIFALLPVDTRLRCVEVNRAWRALLADTTFFASLDLSVSSGVEGFSEALLLAAVAKASGQLRALDLAGQRYVDTRLLIRVVPANAATLTELRMNTAIFQSADELQALLQAAPALSLLLASATVSDDHQVARAMLRNEPPFQAVQLRRFQMCCFATTAAVDNFCSDLRCHASLEELFLLRVVLNTAAAMGALVDACISLRLRELELVECRVMPAMLPELTRLIAGGGVAGSLRGQWKCGDI